MADANTANSRLSTDLSVTPYYDDYNEENGYYRILFKPGYAVQSRELTQMQTILQKQIERHGRHIFEEGSIVIPGEFQPFWANTNSSTYGPLNYVKVKDVDTNNNAINILDFKDVEVRGATSNVTAIVNIVLDGSEASENTKTIYVDYTSSSPAPANYSKFIDGETLVSNVGNLRIIASDATGYGSAFRITKGVVFSKGFFVYFPTQEVVLGRYDDTPTCKVGFQITEAIKNYTRDNSLLDPALESSNYSAPGADRLQLFAELQVRSYDDPDDVPEFVTLFTIKDGIVRTIAKRTQYSIIKEEWAKRTFDESGDYYTAGLNVDVREHLDSGTNGGVYTQAQSGNSSLLSVRVGAGVAYVKGYEVETVGVTPLETEKAFTYANVINQTASAFLGSYITVEEITGNLPLDTGVTINLYDKEQDRLSNSIFSSISATPTGNVIGSAKVASIEYDSDGGFLGTATGRADIYLMDIRMLGSNNFSSVKGLYVNNASTPDFFADVIPDPATGITTLYEPFNSPLLYYTGSNYTRKIKDSTDTCATSYEYTTTLPVTITSGQFYIEPSGSDVLAYTGTLSGDAKKEIFLSVATQKNVTTGITATNVGGNTIVGTNFNKLNLGDKLRFSGLSNVYTIVSKANATHLTINQNPFQQLTGNAVFKSYEIGDYIDLTTLGFDTGTERSVSVSGTQLQFNLNEATLTGVDATVSVKVKRPVALQANKILRPNRFVQINCATSGTSGPFNLGFSDIYKVREIRKKSSSSFTSNTEGTVVTNQFNVDNGQRDTHYEIGSITPITSLSSTDRILVELDYFYPDYSTGKGYFSIDSYDKYDENPYSYLAATNTRISIAEVPIYKSKSSAKSYDLRNHLDFRPVKSITATDTTTVASATENPGISNTFNYSTGIALVTPSSEIEFDYSYYLGRKDVVHVNKDKIFSIKRGVPGAKPFVPEISPNEMELAIITVAPYPSISPYFAKIISRQDIATSVVKVAPYRQTMRDIEIMKERISNLEYYVSLNLLEKNALDLLILDENGNDRFKNGIFVDTFDDHALGATYDPDYRIVIDPKEKSIRPVYSMQSIDYDYLSGSNVRRGQNNAVDIITLDYSEVVYANVQSATGTLNTEKSTYRFIGVLDILPIEDVWIDTVTLPPNTITLNDANIDGMEDATQGSYITTIWNAWQTIVTGYKVYRGTGTSRQLVGTYSNKATADQVAQSLRTQQNGSTVETLYRSDRTGSELYNFNDADTASFGTRVVNVELIPYIRAQTLKCNVTGLKPYARFYVYFDGINMTDYTRPTTEAEYLSPDTVTSWTYDQGDALYANESGVCWFRLYLPNTDNLKFQTGSKLVKVTDSPTNSETVETTFAKKTFFAEGLRQTKQDTILSTRQTEVRQFPTAETRNSSTFATFPPLPTESSSCLAYALPIKAPDGEEGIFITSVEVFCAEKHPTLGVWFEIREMDAGQGITLNQVPLSYKRFKNADVPISSDGRTNGLKVTFDAPVFLYSDRSYAFVIHPEATNPNYYFWISQIGQPDRNTGEAITGRLDTGTTYTTNNDAIWVPLDQVDLTCKWYRASFVSSGSFEIGNKPKEKIYLKDIVGSIEGFGDPIITGERITLSGYSGTTIALDDFIVGSNSEINSRVISINSGTYTMSNIRYSAGETATVRYGGNAAVKGTATIATANNGRGNLEYYKEAANATYMILTNSSGNFTANDVVYDISDEGSASIESIRNQRYTLLDFEPAIIDFNKASQSFELASYSNTYGPELVTYAYRPFNPSENFEFEKEMAMYSRSNEIAYLSSDRSSKVRVTMKTSSNYLSPVFDLKKTQSIIVDNLINNDATDETNPTGGKLFNKYISKVVTLDDGPAGVAEDLKVYITGYRPPSTDIRIWLKVLNGSDTDTLQTRPWIELEKSFGGDGLYSSLSNKSDFKEFTFSVPASYLSAPAYTANEVNYAGGEFQYINSQGITFTGFKSFQIKVGLLGTNSAIIPKVADLRVIALQI